MKLWFLHRPHRPREVLTDFLVEPEGMNFLTGMKLNTNNINVGLNVGRFPVQGNMMMKGSLLKEVI